MMGPRFWHVLLIFATLAAPFVARGEDQAIDFDKARQILERGKRGEKVTDEERAYVQRAIEARRKAQANQPQGKGGKGLPPPPPKWTEHLIPLTELGTAKYKGEEGGLYGGGSNQPPKAHFEATMRESAKIRPLDDDGKPADGGKIGVLSVGMSNTTQEYSRFIALANADPQKPPEVVLVDGAQGGQTGTRWADPDAPLWLTVDERVKSAGLSSKQIQVAWMKQAEAGPARMGEFPKHAEVLRDNLVVVLGHLKRRFPNLRIVYLSSRIYGGYAITSLNPEPYAYEEAFSMRWLIQDQIAGKSELNYDPARGEVKSPLLLWGPYLWADGEMPRKADGFTYAREDLSERDGTHPSETGRTKVAELLLKFLKTDPTAKSWFARN
ncbi:MAG TPA: hypothetical protein PLU30_08460 [Verrucomicrobiae bacterium]|nr:hypothetical protein [Verrucomicrobiae bacterium]